jgi:hypothetical protein
MPAFADSRAGRRARTRRIELGAATALKGQAFLFSKILRRRYGPRLFLEAPEPESGLISRQCTSRASKRSLERGGHSTVHSRHVKGGSFFGGVSGLRGFCPDFPETDRYPHDSCVEAHRGTPMCPGALESRLRQSPRRLAWVRTRIKSRSWERCVASSAGSV